MGNSGTLVRKLDLDLIARIEASGPPKKAAKVKSTAKKPRHAATYRGARWNDRRAVRAAQLIAKRARSSAEGRAA